MSKVSSQNHFCKQIYPHHLIVNLSFQNSKQSSNTRKKIQIAIFVIKFHKLKVKNGMMFNQTSGFCNFRYCTNHLRKKRKLKGAFQRICDNCEDKYLYESYMKYEMKAQQSLAVEEQIVKMKHDSFCDQLEAKQIKFATLKRNLVQIGESYVIKMQQFQSIQQSLAQKSSNLIHQQKQLDRIESQLTEVESGLPRALQDDFLMMQIENEKLTKDLNKLQKRCEELKISILKKEKELETAFSSWQNKVSKDTKAEQKCILF